MSQFEKNEPEKSEGGLIDLINWEKNERSQSFRENGYPDFGHKGCLEGTGAGSNCQIVRGIFGIGNVDFLNCIVREHLDREIRPYGFRKNRRQIGPDMGRCLSASQFVSLYSAVAFANSIGKVMNVHITITWGLLGIVDHSAAARALRYEFLKHLQDWYQHKVPESPFVWLYVHEEGNRNGFHSHIMVDIPDNLRPEFRDWMAERLGNISRRGSVSKTAFKITAPPSDRIGRQWRYFQYLVKGMHPDAEINSIIGTEPVIRAAELISPSIENPGYVLCKKKCGVSNNIGTNSRLKAGFRSLLDRGVADVRQLYAGTEYLQYAYTDSIDLNDPVIHKLLEARAHMNEIAASALDNSWADDKTRRTKMKLIRQERREDAELKVKSVVLQREQTVHLAAVGKILFAPKPVNRP